MDTDRSFFRIESLLLSLCLVPTLTSAIVVRHDRDEALFVNLGREFPSTVMLRHGDGKDGLGDEGTLIDLNWVLTAAHVATDLLMTMPSKKMGPSAVRSSGAGVASEYYVNQ